MCGGVSAMNGTVFAQKFRPKAARSSAAVCGVQSLRRATS
ncbi:hypothetical protein THTE_4237 [Thermogutta terrifontis]|uniref:Uncharacterized protein n=1 Tax=Thermogutta terrifontis TaxID=1331910 RepID=A0A286RLK1_9BACT|nr:hypothetical protein THTE_4237 [Thermogutta terrifontis]